MKLSNIFSRKNRILLRELIVTDFKLRYQGSVLGYMWSLLKPMLLFAILYVVFVKFLKFGSDIEHYPVYLLLGVVLWSFFTEATSQGMAAIVGRGDLIRKINFPKYIIVISGTVSALINLAFNLVVVMIFVLFNGVELHWSAALLPALILELYILALSIAFILSAAYVKFRDVSHIWEVFLQAAFYATPILYPLQMIIGQSDIIAKLLMLNPVAQVIQDARFITITHDSITIWALSDSILYAVIPLLIVILISLWAIIYFKKSQKYFAENV